MRTSALALTFLFGLTIASSARAQSFATAPATEIEPQATACAYAFSSGGGATAFNWCLTVNGNLMRFEAPAGQNHSAGAGDLAEGYAVCSASGTHGEDWGNFIPVPFGAPVVLAGCTGGSSCTIQRDTTDGAFRLVQKFTQNKKETELNIDHTLTNIGAVNRTSVVLSRLMHMYVNNDTADDRADRSLRSAWIAESDAISSTASTTTVAASPFIVSNFPAGCNPAAVVVPTPAGPGNHATFINYDVGSLAPGKKKLVRVQVRRQ